MMYKKVLLFILTILIISITVSARDIEFHLEVEDRYYHSYEEVPAEVSIGNYESSPKNITLIVEIGNRKFKYDYFDVNPNQQIRETVILPQQIPGRHVVKGRIYYEDDLKNAITESVPDDIEVLFPKEIKAYPKRVIIATFELPPIIYGGKSYIVKSNIMNEGDFETKVLVELGSYDEFESMEMTLKPGEIKTVDLNITFYSTGVSFLESRIYYLDGDHKYLVNFFAKESVVTDEKIADLKFQNLELYLESNQEINQNDEVKLKVNLFNKGKFPAFNAVGYLSSNIQGLTMTKESVNYGTISPKLTSGGKSAEDYFEIKTKNTPVQENFFDFSIRYTDNENRTRDYKIPVTIFEGDDKCLMNWDCKEGFFCNQEGDCQDLICDCGEKTEHRCINPTDSKCPADKKCSYYGVCESIPCECGELIGHRCTLPDDSKCSDNKRCGVEGQCEDIFCPDGEIKDHKCDYKCYSDSQCGEGEICNKYNRCDLGCREDSDCPSNKMCNEYNLCEGIPCECGEVINKQCVKYDCCNNFDCGEFETCSPSIHKCVAQTGCMEVMKNGDSKDKVDLLIVGAGYNDYNELKKKVLYLFDKEGKHNNFFSVEPYKSSFNKFNIWMITAPDFKFKESGDMWCGKKEVEPAESLSTYQSVCPIADNTILISDSNFRSYAFPCGGMSFNSLSCYSDEQQGRLILHEFGHSFGCLSDEYTESGKRDDPDEPNCAPDEETAKLWWGDLSNVVGVGYYIGCSYTPENIRPTDNSIMKSHSVLKNDYEPVNERWLVKKLEGFK